MLAAIVCGATLAFLRSNYHPAKIFMGDSGALALGFVLATLAVQGVLKTAATIALVAPLLVMAVPILDTSFVVLKRLKYRRAPWGADHNHFYHRFMRIGFSQRSTAAYLHVWAALLAGYAILAALRPAAPARPLGSRQHAHRCGVGAARGRRVGLDGLLARDPQVPAPAGLTRQAARARRRSRGGGRAGSHRRPALDEVHPGVARTQRAATSFGA